MDWSWELAEPDERALWRRFALFFGGATLYAAEAVGGLPDTLGTLTALVDKSLLIVTEGGRYRMLETIREYGLERLAESGESDHLRSGYIAYFAELAATAEPLLRTPAQADWLRRLTADHDNLHTALRMAIAERDAPTVARLCASLGWYWWMRLHRRECADAVAAMLRLPGLPEDETTALALAAGGLASFGAIRDYEEVKSWVSRAIELCDLLAARGRPVTHPLLRMTPPLIIMMDEGVPRLDPVLEMFEDLFDSDDRWLRAMARLMYGQLKVNLGQIDGAEEQYELGLAEFRACGDRWGTSFGLTSLAEVVSWRGEHERAAELCREALRLSAEFDFSGYDPMIHVRLARQLWLIGRFDEASALMETAVRLADRLGDPESLGYLHYLLAEFDRLRGDPRTALVRLARTMELILPVAGPPQFKALTIAGRALALGQLGRFPEAAVAQAEAFAMAVESRDRPVIATVLVAHGMLLWRRDRDAATAAVLTGAADTLRGSPDRSFPEGAALTEELRAELGDATHDVRFVEGLAMDLAAVTALVEETGSPSRV
ncbi:hypothetical protein GCM10027589_50230 [Actinocorallia lasiicapitis]